MTDHAVRNRHAGRETTEEGRRKQIPLLSASRDDDERSATFKARWRHYHYRRLCCWLIILFSVTLVFVGLSIRLRGRLRERWERKHQSKRQQQLRSSSSQATRSSSSPSKQKKASSPSSSDTSTTATPPFLLDANFDESEDQFTFVPSPAAFGKKTSSGNSCEARGERVTVDGHNGGALQVKLVPKKQNADAATAQECSGAWKRILVLERARRVTLRFWFQLTRQSTVSTAPTNSGGIEISEVVASVDGTLVGQAPYEHVAQLVNGDMAKNPLKDKDHTTGWKLFEKDLGLLAAGQHTLLVGARVRNQQDASHVTVVLDNIALWETNAADAQDYESAPQTVVDRLDLQRFKDNVKALSDFGDRYRGSDSYNRAADWVRAEFTQLGYKVEEAKYWAEGEGRSSLYVDKVGTKFPDCMWLVSAHLDGRGGGGAADDNASGSSAVLEFARVLAMPDVTTDVSIRLVLWNNEEGGCKGSKAYVNQRLKRQGKEDPPNSKTYPEPTWLGILEHDMILYDHGNPAQTTQSATDADIEYQSQSVLADQSQRLAQALYEGSQKYATWYPAKVGSDMKSTDSIAFQDVAPAVSVRENQRAAGGDAGFTDMNPHWHDKTDVYASFSEADFRFGFNFVRMTLGTISELAGLRLKRDLP